MKKPLNECIAFFAKKKGDVVLGKNRDRNYDPTITVVRELVSNFDGKGDVEIVYFLDNDTDWSEGMNEHGICIVNAALMVGRDEKQKKLAKSGVPSKDGVRIRHVLSTTNIKDAVTQAVNFKGGIKGHTIITDGKQTYVIEMTSKHRASIKKVTDKGTIIVRTNHGHAHPDAGYTHGPDYVSSRVRKEKALEIIEKAKSVNDIMPAMMANLNDKPQLNPVRVKKSDGDMYTSSQMLMNATKKLVTLYLIKNIPAYKGIDNRLPTGYEPKIQFKIIRYVRKN